MRQGVPVSAVLLFLGFLLGCGGGSHSTGQLRFLQGSPDAPLVNFVVDGKTQGSNLAYGNPTAYVSLKVGNRRVQVISVNSTKTLFDQPVSVAVSTSETMYLTGPIAQAKPLVLTDANTTSTAGDGYVRVLNISTTMGPADVYIIPAGSSLTKATPVATSLSFGENTAYELTVAGNYQVFMTAPGTVNAFLSTGALNIAASHNQTVVIRDNVPSGFTFDLLEDTQTSTQ